MRRIFSVLFVAALVAAMTMTSALLALAQAPAPEAPAPESTLTILNSVGESVEVPVEIADAPDEQRPADR